MPLIGTFGAASSRGFGYAGGGAKFVTATGGCVSTVGDFKVHVFNGPGTFCVSCAGNEDGSNTVDYLVVAGGGGRRIVTGKQI